MDRSLDVSHVPLSQYNQYFVPKAVNYWKNEIYVYGDILISQPLGRAAFRPLLVKPSFPCDLPTLTLTGDLYMRNAY